MHRLFAILAALACASPALAEMAAPQPLHVEGTFREDDGQVANDISGIACAPATSDGARRCLVINDEDRSAQSAFLIGDRLVAGPRIQLFGDRTPAGVHGEPEAVSCRAGSAAFRDLDGEGVTYAEPYFYVTGSHGCSRNGKSRESIFLLARLKTDAQGMAAGAVDLTFRLGAVLKAAPKTGAYFGKDLDENGVNIEGVAVMGDTLYAGLRAPALDGESYILATPLARLFDQQEEAAPAPVLHTIRLGKDTGVRDLSVMPDGRLLVLYGSAQDQPEPPYGVALLDPRNDALQVLGALPVVSVSGRAGKAEAIMPVSQEAGRLNVLVLYDSMPNGAPHRFALPLQ